VNEGLDGADGVEGFLTVSTDVCNAVLAVARKLADPRPYQMIGAITTGTTSATIPAR